MGFKKFFKGVWKGTKEVAPFILPVVPGGAVAQKVIDAADQKFSLRGLEKAAIVDKLCREWVEVNAPEVYAEIQTAARILSATLPK